MKSSVVMSICLLVVAWPASRGWTADPSIDQLRSRFKSQVQPFLQRHCFGCHGEKRQEAKLKLSGFQSLEQIATAFQVWDLILERLEKNEMPPEDAKSQPSQALRKSIVAWIRDVRTYEANRNAGDPGPVLPRRLSNAEYNNSVRDLTGVDIRPTREFPVNPANEAGFDNSGESLSMSPALAQKYLGAAREVADHLVFTPEGLAFASHPVVTNTDRDKYCVRRIIDFYQRQPTDLAEYFFAAWRYRHRNALGRSDTTPAEWAVEARISPKYLALIWETLSGDDDDFGPIAKVRTMWRGLPDDVRQTKAARSGCLAMKEYVARLRRRLEPQFPNLEFNGHHKGSQTFVLWKNRQYAAHRRKYDPAALQVRGDRNIPAADSDLIVPREATERRKYEAAYARFASVFPDAFYISERGRDYVGKPKDEQEKGRLLSAGFHSMMGYFRDDGPLYEMILSEPGKAELDRLWRELDFVTSAPMRQYTGFVWFERTDSRYMRDPVFDFARAEDKDVISAKKIKRLRQVYLEKARRSGAGDVEIKAIEDYFRGVNDQIRQVEGDRLRARPKHTVALMNFAQRAFRRPLTRREQVDWAEYYLQLTRESELTHEEAIQDMLVAVLMSPHFCYRLDLIGSGSATRPLDDYELASRLSYFLWSSLPDDLLLQQAAEGRLRRPEVLIEQIRRMLRDQRVRGLATEFGGNWLDFRRFEQHNSVDRGRFPAFTDDLRKAMFEEPIRFFMDVAAQNRSVLEFLHADHTFVNGLLAKHYGMTDAATGDDWRRVERTGRYGRGGLLPMSVFLTKNAPGLRTSPVKRGYWVVRRLLGERIPPPPPNVPELPNDEAQLGELSLPQVLARHREHKSCAGCHDRFDSIGLVFEGYGPIGQLRKQDLGGQPVTTSAVFPNGEDGDGLTGLKAYLREHRQQDYLDNLCRKLLSYALGRSLLLSDEKLIQEMRRRLASDQHRFGSLVEAIVVSPQFLNKRGQERRLEE